MKKDKTTEDAPIHVAIPNTTKQKMEAIVAIAHAIHNLSKAIISTNVKVDIANTHIINKGTGNGITIETEE